MLMDAGLGGYGESRRKFSILEPLEARIMIPTERRSISLYKGMKLESLVVLGQVLHRPPYTGEIGNQRLDCDRGTEALAFWKLHSG